MFVSHFLSQPLPNIKNMAEVAPKSVAATKTFRLMVRRELETRVRLRKTAITMTGKAIRRLLTYTPTDNGLAMTRAEAIGVTISTTPMNMAASLEASVAVMSGDLVAEVPTASGSTASTFP